MNWSFVVVREARRAGGASAAVDVSVGLELL